MLNLLEVLSAACTSVGASDAASSAASPEAATSSRCGVDTLAVGDRCVGVQPYGWTRLEDVELVKGTPIQVHRGQLSATECLHRCEMENGADPPRHIVRRCDRVVFDHASNMCRLYDSRYGDATTREASGVTVYVRADKA